MTAHFPTFGDSVQGQGSRSDQSSIGLSLRLCGIAPHPRTGALSADLPLKHLSAQRALRATNTRSACRAHIATRPQNVVALQRVIEVTS